MTPTMSNPDALWGAVTQIAEWPRNPHLAVAGLSIYAPAAVLATAFAEIREMADGLDLDALVHTEALGDPSGVPEIIRAIADGAVEVTEVNGTDPHQVEPLREMDYEGLLAVLLAVLDMMLRSRLAQGLPLVMPDV
jgi:hypothetical protein